MPKLTRYEIRSLDRRDSSNGEELRGGYIMSHEEVRKEKPEAYDAWMKHLHYLQTSRKDFKTYTCRGKKVPEFVDVKFFKTHLSKDCTSVAMGTLFASLSPCVIQYVTCAVGHTPGLSYVSGACTFFQFLAWSGVVGDTEFAPTGYPDVLGSLCSDTRLYQLTAFDKKLNGLKDFGVLPVFSNEPNGEVFVSYKRPKGSDSSPVIIGVAMSVAKMCISCHKFATVDTIGEFKMCGRCKNSAGANVYYCSQKCQLDDYPRHRKICKEVQLVADYKRRYLEAAEKGEAWAACQVCGIKPTKENIHMFYRCARCMKHGAHVVLYCGSGCQRAHYPEHRELCLSRMFGATSESQLAGMLDELGLDRARVAEACASLKCGPLYDSLARRVADEELLTE